MPIKVLATGRITGAPSLVSTDEGRAAVFVLDPLPVRGLGPDGAAHECEVRCRESRLASHVLEHGAVEAWVAVSGELTMFRAAGPLEDDLCAVRVSIDADDVQFEAG